MECWKIQKRLTPYLEGELTPDERLLVEGHLSSCDVCRCVLEDLRKTGALVKDLEEIEPPPWLTQKIMARVREEEERKGSLLRRLFHPLHVKIPLQAFATILIVVAAAFLYKTIVPQREAARMGRETAQVLSQADRAPSPQLEAAAPSVERRGWDQEVQEKSQAAPREAVKQFSAEERVAAHQEKSFARQGPAALSMRQAPPAKAEDSQRTYGAGVPLSMSDQPPPALPQEAFVRAYPAAKSPAYNNLAGMKSDPIAFTVRVTDIPGAVKRIESLLGEEGAHRVKRESREGGESISAELKMEKVNGLLKKLRDVGDTLVFPSDIQAGETVAVRIDLLGTARADEAIR